MPPKLDCVFSLPKGLLNERNSLKRIDRNLALMTQGSNKSLDSVKTGDSPSSDHRAPHGMASPGWQSGAIGVLPNGTGKHVLSAIYSEKFTTVRLLASPGLGAAVTDENSVNGQHRAGIRKEITLGGS